ncbi:MAG: FtsQ-type POTRA domain-containing protein [Anaerococcus sp.]|nr:FtsQ-type POTRA domain-containing protein [Anaerococcus sp.]MDY2918973.1 FtsQ-type POTRA domain-containing protein [Anaerococcus sp.]
MNKDRKAKKIIKSNKDRKILKDGKVKDRSRKVFTRGFAIFLALMSLGILFFNIYRHPYLQVGQIYVSGNEKIDDAEIIAKIGSSIGKNILTYRSKDAEEKLEENPMIDKAQVKKVFPNILNIEVEEIYPVFVLENSENQILVSNKANIISPQNDQDTSNLINLRLDNYNSELKSQVTNDEEINGFLTEVSKATYVSDIDQLNFENTAHIGIIIKDIEVDFGSLDQSSYKIVLLESILKDVENKDLENVRISLVDPKNPVVEINQGS